MVSFLDVFDLYTQSVVKLFS